MRWRTLKKYGIGILAGLLLSSGLASVGVAQGRRHISLEHPVQHGIASYYSNYFNGRTTASGDIFTNKGLTAASNTLPLGTVVKVTNLKNHKWVLVRINDRMNKHNKRTIDLTMNAARELRMIHRGTARVKVEVIPSEFYAFYHVTPDGLIASGESGSPAEDGSL